MSAPGRPRVALVFGGRSSEHAVSCSTAASVLSVIDTDRYDVVPIGITTDGKWVLESRSPDRLTLTAGQVPEVDAAAASVVLSSDPARRELVVSPPGEAPRALGQVDVVFPLLHGPWGEDGTLQGMLEMAGIRYVGAGVLASALGMDKQYMKTVLTAAGLPVMPYVTVRPGDQPPTVVANAVETLGYPVFVKPARGGSSLGISRVAAPEGLAAALEGAARYDPKVLVEAAAQGARELECGVLQSLEGPAEASVVAEVASYGTHPFYDFEAKYLGEEGVSLTVPAMLPERTAKQVRDLSLAAFEAIGCEGLARVDFFWTPGDELVVNEINTMPGFTPTSMYPRLWAASGVAYPELVERLLRLALTRSTGLR
ncbi:MAG TPA: D-alanine--D-alanine ligase family protein [Nocardioidaceae bacterium]|nr:D-alanine--D-alanine ligase family protein [Nocardioidaceae bacterium]